MRDNVKLKLESIAVKQNGSVTERGNDLILSIPEGEGMSIVLTFYSGPDSKPHCSTRYKAKGKEFTFCRRGVDDSFYFEGARKLPKQIAEQRERVQVSQARLALTESFNMGPVNLMLSPDALQKIVDKLKAGQTHSYHPSGFGTGYNFSINSRIRMSRFDTSTKASPELEKLVGRTVYLSSFDAD